MKSNVLNLIPEYAPIDHPHPPTFCDPPSPKFSNSLPFSPKSPKFTNDIPTLPFVLPPTMIVNADKISYLGLSVFLLL